MPLAVDNLNDKSTLVEAREAIDKSFEQCMKEGGRDQKECAGMIYGIARDKAPHLANKL